MNFTNMLREKFIFCMLFNQNKNLCKTMLTKFYIYAVHARENGKFIPF